jgi:hypothetical protein
MNRGPHLLVADDVFKYKALARELDENGVKKSDGEYSETQLHTVVESRTSGGITRKSIGFAKTSKRCRLQHFVTNVTAKCEEPT